MRIALVFAGFAAVFAIAACGTGERGAGSQAAPSAPTAYASAPPFPASSVDPKLRAAAAASARSTDPRWLRAAGEDELERVRLGQEVGAAELLDAIEAGGKQADVALASIRYANDADVALGPLAARAKAADKAAVMPVLEAMRAIAGEPRTQRELLDPEGARAAGAIVLELAQKKELEKPARALAISIARALAEKGYVDRARVPTDLDPE